MADMNLVKTHARSSTAHKAHSGVTGRKHNTYPNNRRNFKPLRKMSAELEWFQNNPKNIWDTLIPAKKKNWMYFQIISRSHF
jgi:hypothetical protein